MVAADGSGMSRKEEGCSDKLHRTNITMLPQHATHAARSIHSVVSFPQSIAAADQAEMEQWWAMHRFPANVLTRLLQQNPAITDMQDLGEVDEDMLRESGMPYAQFQDFYGVVRTDRMVTRLCPKGHSLSIANGLPSYYSGLGWECDVCNGRLERDTSRVLHCENFDL